MPSTNHVTVAIAYKAQSAASVCLALFIICTHKEGSLFCTRRAIVSSVSSLVDVYAESYRKILLPHMWQAAQYGFWVWMICTACLDSLRSRGDLLCSRVHCSPPIGGNCFFTIFWKKLTWKSVSSLPLRMSYRSILLSLTFLHLVQQSSASHDSSGVLSSSMTMTLELSVGMCLPGLL